MAPSSDRSDRIEQLVRATPELVGELSLETALPRIAELARELLQAKYAAVGLLNPDHRTLKSFTTAGMTDEQRARIGALPVGHGVLGLVIREGQVVRLPDLQQHPSAVGFPPNHPPMHSFLGVPIVGRAGIVGDLYLTEKQGAAEFSDEDVHLALLLASIVASAVENAQLHERTIRLLEEVQQLHRSRERFFAMINHELRNALAAVYGWAELMVRRKDPATVPRGSIEILEAAEHAVALINDLLDLNRLDEDRLKPIIRDVDCTSLVRSAIQRVTPAAAERQVTLVGFPATTSVLCRTDAHRVEQIFVNVLTNAVRYAPIGSQVTVTAAAGPTNVEFEILDQGPGVPEDMAEHIFDIYYRAGAMDGSDPGHGVGLALSRRLARLLGGDLWVVPQTGGRFVLRLPGVFGNRP
ncbi:MAG: GAF domain-containing sensor histidine kinase [Gemmatimonadales bacterium]